MVDTVSSGVLSSDDVSVAMTSSKPLAGSSCTVAMVERALFDLFPREWSEPWDRVGLSVGDRAAQVSRIACALDVTPRTIRAAHKAGAQMLVTHHPLCLDMPHTVEPAAPMVSLPSASLWEAVHLGIAVVSMHTNLDRSVRATSVLPRMLGLEATCGIEPGRQKGTGALGSLAVLLEPLALADLARRCRATFGHVSRVFGEPNRMVQRIAFFTGSLGDCGEIACQLKSDVVVCGECGYHRALELNERGLNVILLGHDVSERPLVSCLVTALVQSGMSSDSVMLLPEQEAWS